MSKIVDKISTKPVDNGKFYPQVVITSCL